MHSGQPSRFTLAASLNDLLLLPQHEEAPSSSSLPELKAALQRATAWLEGSVAAPDTLKLTPPHADLARVATALAAARSSPHAAQVLAGACQPLAAATLQLARAASATAVAALAARESSNVATAAAGAAQLKTQLFWACHLTTALHTVRRGLGG
jgi:hypothetical protein